MRSILYSTQTAPPLLKNNAPCVPDRSKPLIMQTMIMEIDITTPALLFPAISVLFLAYANRFLAVANRIRDLHDRFNKTKNPVTRKQIENLRKRIHLIIAMQVFAVSGIICCIISMGLIFFGKSPLGNICFGISMGLIILSLLTSMTELMISTRALNIELQDMEQG